MHEDILKNTLQTVFGFQTFRPGQLEAISLLLEKKRLLCIQPTGYGKSLLYQLPACLLPGLTLVISPLLALMRDQLKHLNERFHIPAAAINTDQTEEENAEARQLALAGKIKVLFIAPEQLDHVDRFAFLLQLPIDLLVVDEAHCISTWGHDFRPSYRQILHLLSALTAKHADVHILALTATADQRVEDDIKRQLILSERPVAVLRENMDRPNIKLSVSQEPNLAAKLATCADLLSSTEGCGLIYCATREHVELVAEFLQLQQFDVAAYHAGFESEDKQRLQQEFLADRYKALVATNALGMGIDKANLRFVIHFDVPGSITAYYQEVGRCGRDGLPSQGFLLFTSSDSQVQQYFIDASFPSPAHFDQVLQTTLSAPEPLNLTAIKRLTGLHPTRVIIILAELVEQGFLSKESRGGVQVYRAIPKEDKPHLTRYEQQQKVKQKELQRMLEYGRQRAQCRMALLRSALGDLHTTPCGHCDVCSSSATTTRDPQKIESITAWLNDRPCPIGRIALYKISAGLSLFDAKMRSPLFIRFMKERGSVESPEEMDPLLIQLLLKRFSELVKHTSFKGIIPIPSRSWKAQKNILLLLSRHVQLPVLDKALGWKEIPAQRQGELLNNDQRHYNVHQQIEANLEGLASSGAYILFDDYTGSGNTLKEAGRALRAAKTFKGELVPFTIASLQWHLGKPGFC
ncbi:MAG: ATP-dependent DNA helicase RecQ [Chlamydiales bacterium]|nr:ATP-dependent DNA helicase RecQ [Chlamydiales bacterium]